MNQTKILIEAKKAIDLWMDKTYNESEFYSHIMTIIREEVSGHEKHKEQLERFLNKVNSMRESQRYYFIHKAKLADAKKQEIDVDNMIAAILSKGYTIERFNQEKAKQSDMFS